MAQSNLLGDILREYARAEIQRIDILNHNGAMLAYTDKANMANKLGLSEQQKLGVTPFPSPLTVISNPVDPTDLIEKITTQVKEQLAEKAKEEKAKEEAQAKAVDAEIEAAKKEITQPQSQTQTMPLSQKVINTIIMLLAAGGITLGTLSYMDKPDIQEGQVGLEVEGWQTK